jgi:tetratricopeptide (TPR) repeat protein
MSITIQLLGRPRITRGSSAGYKLRSRKSWGLLAYLILSERPAARSQLASLLFAEADDPVRALRWCLAVTLSQAGQEPRRQAYALSMLGRISLFRGALDVAAGQLDASIKLAEDDHWLAFLPWPQALRGEVQLARNDPAGAAVLIQQAFARACQLGDPCWEAIAARGLALVAEAAGDTERAIALLAEARARSSRLAEPYLWLDGYILDAQCDLGRRHGHPDTGLWVETLRNLAARSGMRELTLRSLQHGAALGRAGDSTAAAVLAGELAESC